MPPPLPLGAVPYPIDPRIGLAEFERAIMGEPDEIAAAFDTDGRLVLRPRRGKADEVGFFEDETPVLEGATVTHNHPLGVTLSPEDLELAADHDVSELRAVLPTGVVHSVGRPKTGWPKPDAMLEAAVGSLGALRRENSLRRASGRPIMTPEEREEALFLYRRDALRRLGVRMFRTDVWS